MTDIGTLGGDYTGATAINNVGQVVGQSFIATGGKHAFLWEKGVMTDLGTLGGSESYATAINDAGQVVGSSDIALTPPFDSHAFRWERGVMTDLGTLNGHFSVATAINDAGQVLGVSTTYNSFETLDFLWEVGVMTELGTLGGSESVATAINDAGQVVGYANTASSNNSHALLWEGGVMTDLGTLGGSSSDVVAINASGQVVGVADTANGVQHAFLLATDPLPLIFVPGIAGTSLVDRANNNTELWPGVGRSDHERLSLYPNDNPSPDITPFEVIPYVKVAGYPVDSKWTTLYGPLIEELITKGGYREYQVDGQLDRQTTAGCDYDGQKQNQPNLFVFAYDWRKDNAENADKLQDYLGCVQTFYPGKKVNVLTHSMGSLITRRYILKNGTTHNINALITIGAPWLGAPKLASVLETGDFAPGVLTEETTRHIVGSFQGAHQLMPSRAYYELGGAPPFGEDGFDLNQNGNATELYDYPNFITTMNNVYGRESFYPGTSGDAFHAYATAVGGQDDWSHDTTGIQYYHIFGRQRKDTTIGQTRIGITAWCKLLNLSRSCTSKRTAELTYTVGDGTVPLVSAARIGNGKNYNAPGHRSYPLANVHDDLVDHVQKAIRNPDVLQLVLNLLQQANISNTAPIALPNAQTTAAPANLASDGDPISSVPAHYLTINGAASVIISDTLGNSTAPLDAEGTLGSVPEVTTLTLGDHIETDILPTTTPFTVTLIIGAEPLAIELKTGTSITTSNLIRYQDLTLPISVTARLNLSSQSPPTLRYDSDGDGLFETVITPTVDVSSTTGLDTTPPTISIDATPQWQRTSVTVGAVDSGSGVKDVFYSLDGTNFLPYTSTLQMIPSQMPILSIFADDLLGNRSSVVTYTIPTATDTTPPAITPIISGTSGTNGWFMSDVTVTWNITDSESGITPSTVCEPSALVGETTGTTLTCSATNGQGLAHAASVTVKIDKTPPSIALSSPQATSYNHTRTVNIAWTANDTLAGIASTSATLDGTAVTDGQVLDLFTLGLGTHTIIVTATDSAGNTARKSVTFTNSTRRIYLPFVQRNQ